MRWLVGLITIVLLSSCSAQWHLKRAVKKDPTLLKTDTIAIVDTVVTPPVTLTDTVITRTQDTVVVQKDKLKVQVVRSYDTIMVDAVCESDTIVQIVEVPVPSVVMKDSDRWYNKVYKFSFYVLLILLLASLAIFWVRDVTSWLFSGLKFRYEFVEVFHND
jgi:hypothetical protein